MLNSVSVKDKLSALLDVHGTSSRLAMEIGVSRMSLVNWRARPESISRRNMEQIDYLYCRDVILGGGLWKSSGFFPNDDLPLPRGFAGTGDVGRWIVEKLSFGSLEIESPIREESFRRAIQDREIASDLDTRKILEIHNTHAVTESVFRAWKRGDLEIGIRQIREWNARLMQGIRVDAGEWSRHERIIPGLDLRLTHPKDIQEEMESWKTEHAGAASMPDMALAHADFELIHPFGDGNGRTGRIILLAQCLKAGLMPPWIHRGNKALYYATLEHAQRTGDPEPLTGFFRGAGAEMARKAGIATDLRLSRPRPLRGTRN